ncbi:TPA: hemagglutinin repeat-containing protein [Pluralibacter gergoviae]
MSAGSSSQKVTSDDLSNVKKGSVVGSSEGNLTLLAGNGVNIHGSDLVAGEDMTIQGKNVNITAAENSHTALTTRETKSSGLTLGLSGTVGSALNTATEQLKSARNEEDGRLAALRGTQAALTGYQATQAARLAQGATDSNEGNYAGITLSYGSQKSKSENRLEEHTASPSHVQAGRDVTIRATDGDLNIQGSDLQAGRDMGLAASRDINMTSGQNSSESSGSNKSHGGSVGVGVAAGSGSAGFSVSASANQSKGRENGSSLTHTETTASAGRTLTIDSGRDILMQGAQGSGESIIANAGRNLTITSEQDSDRYDMKQTGSSAGASVTWGAGFSGSASVSASRDRMNSNFDSVQEQSGLFAGNGGFDVNVGSHTQLNGGVLASTATPDKNRLDTGTLGWRDIDNQADFTVEHQSAGVSTGGSYAGQFIGNMASNTLVGAHGSGHDSSTTHAAVEAGTITVRDEANQQQDVSTLSRDTEHAANGLSPIFDKEKEQRRLQEAQLIGEIGTQVGDIARTEGDLAGLERARKAHPDYSNDELRKTEEYKSAMKKYGTGSDIQQAISAATAAVQGLAGGDLKAAIAGGAAPYLAEVIHKQTMDASGEVNISANLMAHAVLGAVVASAQGNSALAGASGGALGEYIAQQIYPGVPRDKLTEEQKQTIRALGTLAAGLAGGLTGGSTADAVAGAQAGKNAVENNYLNSTQAVEFDKELADCRKSGGDCQKIIDKWKAVSDKQSAETDQKLKDNPLEAVVVDKDSAQGGIDMTERPGWLGKIPGVDVMSSDEAKAYVQQWNGQDLANIDVNSPGWMSFASYASDPENQAALVSLGMLGKDLINLAKTTVSNIAQGGVSTGIKSMQTGLRNPQQVDQIKNDMISGNYRFTSPEGRIAGYIDSKGNYYISEGNHRMVAAQEIYKKTGDRSYIEKLLQNGSWTQTKNAPSGAKSMPTRK